jgi:hypothetical protein
MAVNVTGSIKLVVNVADVRTVVTGASSQIGRIDNSLEGAWLILSGTTAGLADKIWSDTRTIADNGTAAFDLNAIAGTPLTDAYGATVTIAKLRAVAIVASSSNTTTVQLARPAANGVPLFTAASGSLAPLSAGGFIVWSDPMAGVTVTAATGDLVNVINSAGAIATVTVAFAGTSV